MFEWLIRELADLRTPRFHVVEGVASETLRRAVQDSVLPLPPSYVAFVLRFGEARLYRKRNYHLLRVFAAPREVETRTGEPLLYIGGYDDGYAYLRTRLLMPGAEAPVFEGAQGRLRRGASSFEEWIRARAVRARRHYKRKEWASVLAGPKPFTEEERDVIHARRFFSWKVIGSTEERELMYEVRNGSDRRLPFLSIGIRSRSGDLRGGVFLPVAHIAAGETAVVVKDTYRKLLAPDDVEAFSLPDPGPEERDQYWEFRELPGSEARRP